MTPSQLAERRKALHLTQQQLADALGMYQQTVARWESGTRPIPHYLPLVLRGIEAEYCDHTPAPDETA